MSNETRRLAGILLVVLPSVMFGGVSLLGLLAGAEEGYIDNPVRQGLWRAGHAHAGVWLILSLVLLRYVDEADLSPGARRFASLAAPVAAILVPAAFFLSVLSPRATEPSPLINLAYVGALVLAAGVVTLGVGLIRASRKKGGA
jgi:hypothetical protein